MPSSNDVCFNQITNDKPPVGELGFVHFSVEAPASLATHVEVFATEWKLNGQPTIKTEDEVDDAVNIMRLLNSLLKS